MIVLDLDGTILHNEEVSKNTKKYLSKLKTMGYIIVIATGRIYESVLKVTDNAQFANFIITDAGSCIYDNNQKSLYKKTINKAIINKLLRYYNNEFNYIDICTKDKIYKYFGTVDSKKFVSINNLEVFHITFSLKNNESVEIIYKKLLKEFPKLNIIIMQDSFLDKKWLEIMPGYCTKYNTIKKLADSLNISNKEIIAFGDGLNDIDMLQKCGTGIALKNALPEVKKVANDITTFDYINDGVIKYLAEYFTTKNNKKFTYFDN